MGAIQGSPYTVSQHGRLDWMQVQTFYYVLNWNIHLIIDAKTKRTPNVETLSKLNSCLRILH